MTAAHAHTHTQNPGRRGNRRTIEGNAPESRAGPETGPAGLHARATRGATPSSRQAGPCGADVLLRSGYLGSRAASRRAASPPRRGRAVRAATAATPTRRPHAGKPAERSPLPTHHLEIQTFHVRFQTTFAQRRDVGRPAADRRGRSPRFAPGSGNERAEQGRG